MLGLRRRQWANIKPTMFQCVVIAGMYRLIFKAFFLIDPAISFNKLVLPQTT